MGCGMWVKLHMSGMHLEEKPNLLGVDLDKFVLPQPADPHGAFLEYTKRIQCGNSNATTGRTKDIYMHEQWWIGLLGMSNNEAGLEVADAPSSSKKHESDSSDTKNPPSNEDEESTPNLEHVLNYLNSFDMANGLCSGKVPAKKKRENASHKQHRKPQRKKYRSWRVGGEDGDGMRVVRVFQKPANTGPLKVG